jgi:hypothetical protein
MTRCFILSVKKGRLRYELNKRGPVPDQVLTQARLAFPCEAEHREVTLDRQQRFGMNSSKLRLLERTMLPPAGLNG